jgi:tetrahydromethanopterin S-methyltransferase subunit H
MFQFKAKQSVFEIYNIKVGGQPGENPSVLIGSIFYYGHGIVKNEKTGEFNKKDAENLINLQEEYSEKTRNPFMLDVVGSTDEAIEKYIDFVANVTEAPFLIDSPRVEVRIAGLKYVKEHGLQNRIVYNSIIPESTPEELEALKESGVKSAILLAYKRGVMTSKARAQVVKVLLLKAKECGISKPLVDTFVIDVPSLSSACRAILDLKNQYGVPCGCGSHNAISTWAGFDARMGAKARKSCEVTLNVTPLILGADFVLYGPVENCKYLFPSVYAINSGYKYLRQMKEQMLF